MNICGRICALSRYFCCGSKKADLSQFDSKFNDDYIDRQQENDVIGTVATKLNDSFDLEWRNYKTLTSKSSELVVRSLLRIKTFDTTTLSDERFDEHERSLETIAVPAAATLRIIADESTAVCLTDNITVLHSLPENDSIVVLSPLFSRPGFEQADWKDEIAEQQLNFQHAAALLSRASPRKTSFRNTVSPVSAVSSRKLVGRTVQASPTKSLRPFSPCLSAKGEKDAGDVCFDEDAWIRECPSPGGLRSNLRSPCAPSPLRTSLRKKL